MIELTERTRSRWLWLLAAVTAAYGLANLVVFYTTGSFGPVWFAAGVVVYSLLLVGALALSLVDPGRPAAEGQAAQVEATAEELPQAQRAPVELIDHETLYETRTGRVLRTRFRAEGTERTLLFAVTDDEVAPLREVERRIDESDLEPREIEDLRELEDALERRARQASGSLDPDDVHVEMLDHEPLYEAEEGCVIRARYRVNGDEHASLFAVTEDGVEPIQELEERLDEVAIDELAVEPEAVYEQALVGHAPDEQPPSEERTEEVIRR